MSTPINELKGALALQGGSRTAVAPMSSGMGVEADRAIAQVQGAMVMAKRFPRDEGLAATKILECCELVPVAEDSFYSFPRGGSVITGPSIDLLKICARYWGNIDFSVQELERQTGQSIAIAIAIDLETNARSSRTFVVPHFRDKNDDSGNMSGTQLTSTRDIYELIANYGSRRLRSCLEDLIPPHIVGKAFQACQDTLAAAAAKEPLIDRLKILIPAFKAIGVTDGMLIKFLGGRAIAEMMEQEYVKLRNIHRSIKSGAQRVEDFFEKPTVADSVAAGKATNSAKTTDASKDAAVDGNKKNAAEKPAAQENKNPAGAAVEQAGAGGAQASGAAGNGPLTKADVLKMVAQIKEVAGANAMGKIVKKQTHLPAAELAEIRKAVSDRVEYLNSAAMEQQEREPGSDDDAGDEDAPE